MSCLRLVQKDTRASLAPCSRCGAGDGHWDRILTEPICPECQEELVLGRGAPLIVPVQDRCCVVCARWGTVPFQTFPVREPTALEMDLCPRHLRSLLGRRLTVTAFQILRRQLNLLGFAVEQLFLLHESFYDEQGEALQPVPEID